MSKISDFYVELNSLLATIYPNHKKMCDPYNPERNDRYTLNKGYGFYIGSGSNTNRNLGCQLSISRELNFINTMVNRGTELDKTIRESAEKTLLEDQYLLIKQVEKYPAITNNVSKIRWNSDSGIELLVIDEINYLLIKSVFEIEYFEAL